MAQGAPQWGFPHTSDLTVIVIFLLLRQSATHDSIPHYFSKAITNIPKPVDLQFHCKGFSAFEINERRYINMKITVYGKAHLEGVAKKTGNPYNFNQVHYLGKARGVIGQAALTLALDPSDYPIDRIEVGKEYNVEFDNRGYVVDFSPAK